MKIHSFLVLVLGLLTMALGAGCAGARSEVVMPKSRYPVSMSNGMYGPNRELLKPDQMQKVGEIHIERTAWGMLYSAIPFTPELDVSSELNAQVAARKGDGVIRLRTEVSPCALDYFFVLTFIPFWPGCALVDIKGDIVRYKGP